MVALWVPGRFLSSSVLASAAVLIAWFDNLQKALCAPQLEQDWCSRLLQKKLTFGQGTPLLSTTGFDWDYCGKDLVEDMRASVQQLHDKKGRGEDKQDHPLFIAFAGPGQGKSRLLTEFPGLVAECLKDLKIRRFSDEPLAFLLTCENGLGPGDWATEELNARRFVACRMLWQLREANQQAFDDAGAPTNFAKFRADCHTRRCHWMVLPPANRSLATVVIGLRACLSGKVLSRGQTLGSLNPEMGLIRIEYLDSSTEEYRIGIPYIWLQLISSRKRGSLQT